MDGGTTGMVGYRKDIVGFGITGDAPGVLARTAGNIALHMFGIFVGIGIDDYIVEAEILAGVHDPDGNLPPVRDENLSFQTVPHMV